MAKSVLKIAKTEALRRGAPRRSYIRGSAAGYVAPSARLCPPLGGLCFAAFGNKVKVRALCAHIFIKMAHSVNWSGDTTPQSQVVSN